MAGALTVVGTGIGLGTQLTPEAASAIAAADELVYLAGDAATSAWIAGLHPRAASLADAYEVGMPREQVYERIVDRMLTPVRAGGRVCAAFYGHPGVYVNPSHEAVRRARAEGFDARMLPGISAEDCLFADLGVDPADAGCASFDATDFLLHRRIVDPTAALVLWQVGVIGELATVRTARRDHIPVLVERLSRDYPLDHRVTIYEASPYPIAPPVIDELELGALRDATLTLHSTLYVPPAVARRADAELAALFATSPAR